MSNVSLEDQRLVQLLQQVLHNLNEEATGVYSPSTHISCVIVGKLNFTTHVGGCCTRKEEGVEGGPSRVSVGKSKELAGSFI